MRKWIDQSTFDELLLANAEDNIERAIQGASAVLEAVQEFVLPCYTRCGQPEKLFRGGERRFPQKRHSVSRPQTHLSEILLRLMCEKISLDYRCRTLDDFLALSDNKLILKP